MTARRRDRRGFPPLAFLLLLLPGIAGSAVAEEPHAAPTEIIVHLLLRESRDGMKIAATAPATLASGEETAEIPTAAPLEFLPVPDSDRLLVFAAGRLIASGADIQVRSAAPFTVPGIADPVGPANGLRLFREDGKIRCVLRVGLTAYIEGVLVGEMGGQAPLEALKAQAVAARTYVARRMNEKGIAFRHHLGTTTLHQVFRHTRAPERIREAVRTTEGEIVIWRGRPALTVYSACCGGAAEAAEAAFGGGAAPYLVPRFDRPEDPGTARGVVSLETLEPSACAGDRLFRWRREFTAARLAAALGLPGPPQGVRVTTRSDSGRARRLTVELPDGEKRTVEAGKFRAALDLPSTLLFIERKPPDRFLLHGGGFGHGVGLCQSGAKGLARRGLDHRRILQFYYPGTEILRIY